MKGIYREAFAEEFSKGKQVASRERIASSLWKASPSVARKLCEVLQQRYDVKISVKQLPKKIGLQQSTEQDDFPSLKQQRRKF